MNGEVTLPEAYKANLANSNKSAEQVVVKHDEEYYHVTINMATGKIKDDALHSGFNQIVGNVLSGSPIGAKKRKKKKNSKEVEGDETLVQQAMQKLIASNGNEGMLDVDEKMPFKQR